MIPYFLSDVLTTQDPKDHNRREILSIIEKSNGKSDGNDVKRPHCCGSSTKSTCPKKGTGSTCPGLGTEWRITPSVSTTTLANGKQAQHAYATKSICPKLGTESMCPESGTESRITPSLSTTTLAKESRITPSLSTATQAKDLYVPATKPNTPTFL
jgi:hypothetical protein